MVNRSERRQKQHLIGVRVDDATFAHWTEAAAAHGVTVPELVRACTDHILSMAETQAVR